MWAHIHRAVYFGLDRQGQMVIPGLSMFHVLFTLLHLLHNQGRTLRTSASMFYWCTVPACLCALDLSEGADITAPPFVSFCLAHCCSEARSAERDGWEHITPPLAMCFLLASHPSHLSWSICLCRVNYGSLDQSNCCLEQLWQDEWEGSQRVKKQGWILTNRGKSNASKMDVAPRKHEILNMDVLHTSWSWDQDLPIRGGVMSLFYNSIYCICVYSQVRRQNRQVQSHFPVLIFEFWELGKPKIHYSNIIQFSQESNVINH